jgi:MYXO-CTERM domain-containing protein
MGLAIASRRAALLGAALACLAAPAVASANGRYPAAGQIALDPRAPDTILVRATYGLSLTKNNGQDWGWICEDAVGFGGTEDPMLAFAADGSILAGTFEGLRVSLDTGCDWGLVGGGLAGFYVTDLAMEKNDPSKGVLLAGDTAGLVQLWETGDDGATWTQAGVSLPSSFVGVTVETAPSDRNRVYASGSVGPPSYPAYPGLIERSDDRGATWQPLFIPGSDDQTLPYISGVDPQDPDVLYVRLDGNPTSQLIVSKDGGATWAKIFESKTPEMGATSPLPGFALSPDGSTVAVGGPNDGLWTAAASTLAFTKVSTMSALCLTWSSAGLYGCADEIADDFTAGISKDQGKTWTPLLHLAGLCGPLACGAESGVAMRCTDLWPLVAIGIGAPGCLDTSSRSASSGAGGGGGGGGHGCACALAGGTTAGLTSLAAALLGAGGLAARRRRRT